MEENISPNETPSLIRAADTDNAVTSAGAIYLGVMSTDKSGVRLWIWSIKSADSSLQARTLSLLCPSTVL